jgi:uncharacterized protein YndB with AHSA1/START domain
VLCGTCSAPYPHRVKGSVTVRIEAPPDRIWDLVSDVTRIGEFSPETFEAQWLDGADGPRPGARFRGHVRRNGRGPVYWTTCTVTAAEPGREFAFSVAGLGGATANTWRYSIEPAPASTGKPSTGKPSTDVTESFELPATLVNRLYWLLGGPARLRTNLNGMRTTLERIKAVVEQEQE